MTELVVIRTRHLVGGIAIAAAFLGGGAATGFVVFCCVVFLCNEVARHD